MTFLEHLSQQAPEQIRNIAHESVHSGFKDDKKKKKKHI